MPNTVRNKTELGEAIRQRSKEINTFLSDLAEKAGLSEQTVRNCVAGRNYPSIDVLASIALALGVTVDSLIYNTAPSLESFTGPDVNLDKLTDAQKAHLKAIMICVIEHVDIVGSEPVCPVKILRGMCEESLALVKQAAGNTANEPAALYPESAAGTSSADLRHVGEQRPPYNGGPV